MAPLMQSLVPPEVSVATKAQLCLSTLLSPAVLTSLPHLWVPKLVLWEAGSRDGEGEKQWGPQPQPELGRQLSELHTQRDKPGLRGAGSHSLLSRKSE